MCICAYLNLISTALPNRMKYPVYLLVLAPYLDVFDREADIHVFVSVFEAYLFVFDHI